MKKIYFFLMAILVSLASLAATLGEGYSKVTDIATLSVGDKVVLYCDDAELGVTGWNGVKDATVATEGWVEYIVEAADGGVRLQDEDQYIALTAKNGFYYTATGSVCNVNAEGVLYITLDGTDYFLYENAGSYYRMYIDKSSYASYKPFYMYKVTGEGGGGAIPPSSSDYYITGSPELVGADNAWNVTAIAMTYNADGTYSHTFTALPAGTEYKFKVNVGSWMQSWGFEAVLNAPEGVTGDADGNVVFTLLETTDVTVNFNGTNITLVYNFGESETPNDSIPDPVMETVYFVNAQEWSGTINAYAWEPQNAGWPGLAATKETEQIGGYDVYSYTAESGTYANVIFNNGSYQTADLIWTAGMYYVLDGWYTREEVEAMFSESETPENQVTFDADVDNEGVGTDSNNATSYKLTKNGVTMTVSSGVLGTYNNENHYRIYKGQTLTLSSSVGNIVSVEVTCTANDDAKYGPGCLVVDGGDYSYEEKVGTWSGNAAEVVFMASTNQVRATQIVVTVENDIPTNEELWESFKTYYKVFYNEERADQPITAVASFMTKGELIFTDATSEYKWLGDYLVMIATEQGYTINSESLWRWYADAFFQANQHTSWPATADFTEAGKPENWGPYYLAAKGTTPTEPQDEYWELVTDVTSLVLDDQVVIVAKDIACALGADRGTNRAQASVVKTDNRITLSEDVQILTLEPGTKEGTYAFSTDSGYLYAASSIANQLKTKVEKDDNGSWTIAITDDIATIKAQGTNERNWLRFNSSASVFSCYSSGQGDVLLYKHIVPGGIVSRPIISADSVEFFHAATVTIAAADSLEIYYTTDGSDPVAKQSTLYTGTFTLTEDALLKAIAYNTTTDKSSKIVSQQFYHVPTITCQEASAIALAVSGDGVLTERTYRIVAYVTGNVEPISSGQQVFDVADTADGESVLLSYYCQVPEGGVEIGMKVEMVGQLTKYNGIAEMKYGTVTILEGVPTTLYFIPNSNWKMADARFAAYLYGDAGASTWADMTLIDAEAGVYSFLVDRHLYDYVIFTRMNPTTTENSWENKWNQSADITIPQDMNCATMDEDYWDFGTVVWSVYGENPDDILPMDTIYYVNSQSWSDVNVYAWNEELGSVNATWPGEPAQMTGYQINGYDVYYYVAEQGEYTHCIFNSYSGMQTDDLVWSSGKYYYNDVWYTYDELLNNDNNDVMQSTYTVAGSSGLLGTHWDVADTTNNMTLLEDGTYQLIKTDLSLVAGTYEYKVVRDHSWDWCRPSGPNQVLSIDKDGIYTVTFTLDLSIETISATAELQQEAVVIPKVFLIGTMNDWDYTATELQLDSDSLTASVTVMLNANTTYDYQMVVDGNWFTSYDGMMTRDNSQGWQFKHVESSTTYASVYTDIAGEYTFVWNYADNTVSVIYPDICSVAPELQWYNGIVMSQMQTGWYKLSVASLTEYASLTSVSLTNDLYNPVKITVDYYTACEGFKIMQGTTTTFATGVTTVNVNIGELMNYIKYIPNIEFVYLYISIEEVEMGYAYKTITDYVCDGYEYIDPITGNNHLISSLFPNSQIWTDTVHVHETLDSIYIFQITPIVAPEMLSAYELEAIGAIPHLAAGHLVDVTNTAEAIMAYYNAHDTEALADVVRVEWVAGAGVTLPCDADRHSMKLLIETTCDYALEVAYEFHVVHFDANEIVIESCGPYTWNGITYTESGEYYVTNEEGCIVEILYLTVHPIEDEITSATICYGETFLWEVDGKEYTETTHVEVVKLNEYGCEVTHILDLTVSSESVEITETATICYGEYYNWIDGYYNETGVYETIIHNEYGCDSIIATLHLTVLPEVPETVIEKSIYDGEEYMWHDEIYTEEGEYSITLQDINGCDSVVILHLTVKPIYEDEWALLKEIREDLITNNAWQTPWDVSTSVSSWRGVELYNGHVIEIDLSSQGLMGTFPTKILQLPHLEYLSLADNQLTGDAFAKIQTDMTTFVATNPTFVSALIYLDISYNQFTGNVGIITAMSKLMPNLSTLQANNNRLKDVIPMIPQKINVDLSEQDINHYVHLDLSNLNVDPMQLPTILLYDHLGQTYFTSPVAIDITNYSPNYTYKHDDPWGIMIDKTNDYLTCLNGEAYRGKNGDTLYLSYPYADVSRDSYCRMTLSFEMADANFVDGVNVADLQSTILYAFGGYNNCAFNLTAADTYTDNRINVQDVIRTVDILLAKADINTDSATMRHIVSQARAVSYDAEIVVENNTIKLITNQPIAALQISAIGDVQWLLNGIGMEQTTAHQSVVAYSLAGNYIPAGETIIGYCQGNVEITQAELSDAEARMVAVSISGKRTPTEMENIEQTTSEQLIYDVLGRKHDSMQQQGLYIIKSNNQYIKVYNHQ